jgi:hypothetical protein
MKKYSAALFLLIVLISVVPGCKRRMSDTAVKKNLTDAMKTFLNTGKNIDHSKISFDVVDVTYFEDKTAYDCEFRIHMKSSAKDTVGTMGAQISKDFSTVKRKF